MVDLGPVENMLPPREWDRRPRVLICTDSPFIDTGFGRVGREIGNGLALTGRYDVAHHAWYHKDNDRLAIGQMFFTEVNSGRKDDAGVQMAWRDQFGAVSYPEVIQSFQPDLVIALGDEHMVRHVADFEPRTYQVALYIPVDGVPIPHRYMETFVKADHLVMFGEFASQGLKKLNASFPWEVIPHGVDCEAFYPLPEADRDEMKRRSMPMCEKPFVVGTVARNNARKNLPRLFKTFKRFIASSRTCTECGNVYFTPVEQCPRCQSTETSMWPAKTEVMLYLHMQPKDPAGHNLFELIDHLGLSGRVVFPKDVEIGLGISDMALNRVYNMMDVFTLPTGGEGWGLPIMEAMACGRPVLVSAYSAHMEFVAGAGEFIAISEYLTIPAGVERAIVDLNDYLLKLEMMYYPHDQFLAKWGPMLRKQLGVTDAELAEYMTGPALRDHMGTRAVARAQEYAWPSVVEKWLEHVDRWLQYTEATTTRVPVKVEVL